MTSTHSGEGKSATVANLGVVLARAGKSVTLVSADLRRPRLHEFFQRDGQVGLSDVLAGRLPLDAVVQEVAAPVIRPHGSVDRLDTARIERARARGSGGAPRIRGHGEGPRGSGARLGHRADRRAARPAGDGCSGRCRQ